MHPDIQPTHLAIVCDILRQHLPKNTTVWVFGSRATKAKKPFSDLDLLFDYAGQRLPKTIMADLADAFEESDLPYKVDLVDWNDISDSFRACIQDKIRLDYGCK